MVLALTEQGFFLLQISGRRAYVLAFRTTEMVEEERRLGFSHSHNDTFNWDAFHAWQEKADGKKEAKAR